MRRLFDDDGSWSFEGKRLQRELRSALEAVLADEDVRIEGDGKIDLRDFHFVAVSAVGEIVSRQSIRRALGETRSQRNIKGD